MKIFYSEFEIKISFRFICFYFLGSKVCYDEDTHLTKKIREALKSDGNATGSNSSSNNDADADGKENNSQTSTDSTTEQQNANANAKEADGESMKKRDKV